MKRQTLYRRRRTLTAANIVNEIRSAIETSARDRVRGWNRDGQWIHWERMLKEWVRGLVREAREAEPEHDCWVAPVVEMADGDAKATRVLAGEEGARG